MTPGFHRLLRLLAPALFGVAVYQVNIIILRNIASFLPSGQVTYYYNASRLTELVAGLFAFAFTTASFPDMSQHAARADWDKTTETLRFAFAATMFFVVPSTVGLIIAAQPIIAMMYLRGAYSLTDAQQTIPTLQAFALGLPAVTAIRLLVSVCYAFKDTKTPVLAAALSLLVTGGLGWWWSRSLEVVGLAMGLSAGTWFQWSVAHPLAGATRGIRLALAVLEQSLEIFARLCGDGWIRLANFPLGTMAGGFFFPEKLGYFFAACWWAPRSCISQYFSCCGSRKPCAG